MIVWATNGNDGGMIQWFGLLLLDSGSVGDTEGCREGETGQKRGRHFSRVCAQEVDRLVTKW